MRVSVGRRGGGEEGSGNEIFLPVDFSDIDVLGRYDIIGLRRPHQ